ncbi:MAG TPA: S9 family peptidase [Rhizomicrobium sp.]|nr:S9 family peptidase [Rhizomicrobium sp.]
MRDIARIVQLADPHFSPDGRTIAVVETRADLDSDEFRSEIMLVDTASRVIRPLTRERHHARLPRWSPRGDAIAFLAPDGDHKQQLFVMPMNGGDALQLTKCKDDVQQFAWSPDGQTIAFAVADAKPELKGEDKFRTAFKVGDDDLTLTEAVRPTHIWIVSAQGGEAKRLTKGAWSLPSSLPPGSPSSPLKWSPDGRSIVFVHQESPSTGQRFQTQIEVLDVETGAVRAVTGTATLEAYPEVSPDGATIAYWRARDGDPWKIHDVWLAPFAGGAGRDISLALDKNVYETAWMPDGKSLLVGGNVDTTVGLWKLGLDGSVSPVPLGGIMPTNAYWMDVDVSASGAIAFIGQSANDPYELYLIPADGRAPAALTHENAGLSNLTLARTETVTWKSPGGQVLDGVVTYPANYREGKKYPLVLYIHGGPNSASRQRFGVVEQSMAAQGWVIFEPNYRGSDNMGNAFHAAIYKDAGQGPGEDVMAGVEMLKARGLVDPSRMAVSGWSYGGFMTTWLAGHYPVWKAAVAGAAVTDWVEMYDLSDGNVNISDQVGMPSPYTDGGMAEFRRQSPDIAVTQIRAPTLIMSDTGDFRVPITQSFGLYRALKDNHVTTEFYAIPVRGHSPGDPVRQMDVYRRWIDWLETYLK